MRKNKKIILPKLDVPEKYQPYKNVSLDRNRPEVEDPTPIKLLERILDLIWEIEKDLKYENLLGHARDYIGLTIREIEKGLNDV